MAKYCTASDVQRYLPINIIVQGDNSSPNPFNPEPESVTIDDIEDYIQDASDRIDGALSTIYDIPLKKINQGGIVAYPHAITNICAILTSQMLFERRLQGADRQRSESQKEREKWAESELMLIQNGERRLVGQRPTRGSRFVRGTLWDMPKNPSVAHKSDGQR